MVLTQGVAEQIKLPDCKKAARGASVGPGPPLCGRQLAGANLRVTLVLLLLVARLGVEILKAVFSRLCSLGQLESLLAGARLLGQGSGWWAEVGQLGEVHEVFKALDCVFCMLRSAKGPIKALIAGSD